MQQGYIKLHRQLQDSWIWFDDDKFSKGQAWVDLLMLANHKDNKIPFNGDIIIIKRGQHLTSMRKLASRWNWSISTVSRFLNLLEKDEMIVKNSDTNRTLITIVNYGKFQDRGTTDGTTHGTTNGTKDVQRTVQSLPINNNDNNINNDNNKAAPAPRPFTPYKGYGDKPKQTMFHNGEQNHYDFAELERQLLERDRPI